MTEGPDAGDGSRVVDLGDVSDLVLRSVLEFAVGIAAAGQRLRPPLPYPPAFKPYLKSALQAGRLDAGGLRTVRRAIVADDGFRSRLGLLDSSELVDEIGRAWLRRDDGWQDDVRRLLAAARQAEEDESAAAALRKAEKRREAAEQVAARANAELIMLREGLERERRRAARADEQAMAALEQVQRLRDDITGLRREVERLRALLETESQRISCAESATAAARERLTEVERIRDELLAARHDTSRAAPADPSASVRPDSVGPSPVKPLPRRRERRTPIAIPGGLYGDSVAAADHLLRVPKVCVVVDGYNVAKAAWPHLDLIEQRERCIDTLEDVARRLGADVRVVFDGADVVGASSGRRLIRVQFSPMGVTADDVIRAEVGALPAHVGVVVVTNDQAIVNDMRPAGANVVSTTTFLALAGRSVAP
ncbi:MAG: NYN domain-containing protein [Ilumatobacteraceae bacterium]